MTYDSNGSTGNVTNTELGGYDPGSWTRVPEPAAAPEPACLALLGSATLGMALARRRRG